MANATTSLLPQDSHCSERPPTSADGRRSRVALRRSFEINRPSTPTQLTPEEQPVTQAVHEQHGSLRLETSSRTTSLLFGLLAPFNEIFQDCINLLAESHLSLDKVHHISIASIVLHLSLHEIAQVLPHAPPGVIFHWLLPVFAAVVCMSGVIILLMKCYPSQLVVVGAITTLFAVECLLPFAIAGCTIMCIGNVVSLSDLILLSGCLLGFCSFTSWGIRQVLYPSLGLG